MSRNYLIRIITLLSFVAISFCIYPSQFNPIRKIASLTDSEPETLAGCGSLNEEKPSVTDLDQCYDSIMAHVGSVMETTLNCNYSPSVRKEMFQTIAMLNSPKYANAEEKSEDESNEAYLRRQALPACHLTFIKTLLCDLTPKEQNFIASVIVTWGEARGASVPYFVEYHGIRKVIENRTRILNSRYPGKNYNLIHAALQDNQFSLFNKTDSAWLVALGESANSETIQKSILAYQDYPNETCTPTEVCDHLVSYHARWMDQKKVGWAYTDGVLLPRSSFKFNDISNVNASANENAKMSPLEQRKRHWFYVEANPDVDGAIGVDNKDWFRYSVNDCTQHK